MYILKAIINNETFNFPLYQKEKRYILGSKIECDIFLPYKGVSRKHCEFYYYKEKLWVNDLDSTNGTYLNGKKIKSSPLENGSILQCGIVEIKVLEKPTSEWISIEGDTVFLKEKKEVKDTEIRKTEKIHIESKLEKVCNILFDKIDFEEKISRLLEALEIQNIRVTYEIDEKKILIFERIINPSCNLVCLESIFPGMKIFCSPLQDETSKKCATVGFSIIFLLKNGLNILSKESIKSKITKSPVGVSKIAKELWDIALKYKDSKIPMLITGETGVGKEYFAYSLHKISIRKDKPFIVINLSEIPDTLIQSELFGIEEHVATGVKKRLGKFELANGGAVLIDEVADLAPCLQMMLLRVLDKNYIYRIGGKEKVDLDVKFYFCTNKNLEEEVKKGRLREDFYYRINIAHFHIPPLRERKEDIEYFLQKFLDEQNELYGKNVKYSLSAWEFLKKYSWPGNLREMKNEIERLYPISLEVGLIQSEMIDLKEKGKEKIEKEKSLKEAIEEVEKEYIIKAINKSKNLTEAIESLGISRASFYEKIKKYKIKI